MSRPGGVRVGGRVNASARWFAASALLAGLGWLSALSVAPADGDPTEPEKAAPSKCDIKGKIDGRVARLTLTFEFVTEKRNATLQLPAAPGPLADISLDGRTPGFREAGK